MEDIRGSPLGVATLEEMVDDNHAIISSSIGPEYYVNIMSFVDKVRLPSNGMATRSDIRFRSSGTFPLGGLCAMHLASAHTVCAWADLLEHTLNREHKRPNPHTTSFLPPQHFPAFFTRPVRHHLTPH